MWYVLWEDGIYGEYESFEEAEAVCDRLLEGGEDAWLSSDEDDEPWDFEMGFDPYEGCYTYDC